MKMQIQDLKKEGNKKNNIALNLIMGTTLIETLLYSFLVTMITTFTLFATYQIINSHERSINWIELEENQQFFAQKLEWLLQNNATINIPAANNNNTLLSVNKINYGDNPLIINSADGVIYLQQGAAIPFRLTTPNITVSNLFFEHRTVSGKTFIKAMATFTNKSASSSLNTLIFIK